MTWPASIWFQHFDRVYPFSTLHPTYYSKDHVERLAASRSFGIAIFSDAAFSKYLQVHGPSFEHFKYISCERQSSGRYSSLQAA